MHVSNKYNQERAKRLGNRNAGHMAYTDLLETFIQNQRYKKLQPYLIDDLRDDLDDD